MNKKIKKYVYKIYLYILKRLKNFFIYIYIRVYVCMYVCMYVSASQQLIILFCVCVSVYIYI
jgi:hypothetical protein